MLTEDEIRKIIKEYLENEQIDTAFFANNDIDLEAAKEMGLISQRAADTFEVTSIEALKRYAQEMIEKHSYNQCVKAYKKCYEQNPNDDEIVEEYFYYLIKTGNFEEAYNVFGTILELDIPTYRNCSQLFMLLFSRIITIPKGEREFLNSLREDDFLLPEDDPRYKFVFALNNARRKTYLGNENLSLRILENQFKFYENGVPRDLHVYWCLELKALNLDIDMQTEVSKLVGEEKYSEALNVYREREEKTPLKFRDKVIKHLIETIIHINEGQIVTNNDLFVGAQTFALILNDNFILAREEENKRVLNGNKNPIITTLLDRICAGLTPAADVEVSINDLEYYLILGDYDNLFRALNNYLKKIGKKEYFAYVTLLIALDGLTYGSRAIESLKDGSFNKFAVEEYKDAFEKDYSNQRYATCRVYYYLLKELEKLGIASDININYYKDKISHKSLRLTGSEHTFLWQIDKASNIPVAHVPISEKEKKYMGVNGHLLKLIDNAKEKKNFEVYETEDGAEYSFLVEQTKKDDNIRVSSIKDGRTYTIFIKYVRDKSVDESGDYTILGDESYIHGNFKKALKFYKKALGNQRNLELETLKKLILCYLALNDLDKAKFYISICSKLAQIRGLQDIYATILSEVATGDIVLTKGYFESTLNYSNEDCDFTLIYEQIAYLVTEEGLSFEEATSKYKLPFESILDLKLYYAEYAFVLGSEEIAMMYINNLVNSGSLFHKVAALDLLERKDELKGSKVVPNVLAKFLKK